ncbi:UDP-N-acetylmuramoyl-tripeptide--D-alanyl-D-alanine ligase [Loktanella fryxellensis]|uniref:UDP-N-acetylmuramoyl-tripeptide--D-alanyl-D-alanine ligase n=1 Tax=Loktanella fryxellensis TaxID=245187 RepID=A0A1H7Z5E8_9RHOB|nr:UDP-N-acetylmuramoyl-tripeptide--D-alanyl-D-alanine ligase [Loktanella fryxellensis]SEM53670.1 UDP-N-acetylmuramoyl-tripeptide--D-alanyl-D-alanine ligase [Loktanella fryxellensis]
MGDVLWTAAEAAAVTHGATAGDWQATGVSIDTRTLQPGDLFVALQADRDGHDFVAQALAAGAAAALVSRRPDGVAEDAPLLVVDDVLAGLVALGVAARARTTARIVGVTGSVGKTSTKDMLHAVLSRQGRTHAAQASYNNHWGVPLTLARMPRDADYAVIEIGMNHPGEIAPLARMARPHVALITTVAAAHLEAFADLDGIAHEKASIMDGLEPGGIAVLNADLPTSVILRDHAAQGGHRAVFFGADADWTLGQVRITDITTVIEAHHDGTDYLFKLAVPGRHFAMNAVAVLAACDALGADPVQAAQDIGQWEPPVGRGTREVIVLDQGINEDTLDLIDDAFNANPASMAAALEVLAAAKPRDGLGRIVRGRRVAILGDMLELGPDEMALHAAVADDPHLATVHVVHCAGPRMRALFDALPQDIRGQWAPEAADLAAQASRLVDAGDVVLVKGSKGSKVSRVVDAIRKLGHRPGPIA